MKLQEYISLEEKRQIFGNYCRIDSASEFDCWYSDIVNRGQYFRGLKEAAYKNYTSAQRFIITNALSDLPNTIVYKQVEKLRECNKYLYENYCKSIGIKCTDFLLMSLAQHYNKGISPLIDVTTDINTALFFMCDEAEFPPYIDGALSKHEIGNYASMYIVSHALPNFDEIIDNIMSKVEIQNVQSEADFHEKAEGGIQRIFSAQIFSVLSRFDAFLIDNKPYRCTISNEQYSHSEPISFGNLHITAQDGCFIYYDNEDKPLENGIDCVDIHKSLIPYITNKHLIPNGKTKDNLFPDENHLVSNAYEQMFA